jgi:Tol biopolymer transport system component/DNA-binding winged helix-turn-helix (wHTH) protein
MEASKTPRTAKVTFGLFEFDAYSRQLRKEGRDLKLQGLPLRLLGTLLESPGELISHDHLRRELWGNTVVNYDDGLHTAVRKLRDALGDSASSPRFIATIPGRGYRFIAPVARVSEEKPPSQSRAKIYAAIAALAVLTVSASLLLWWREGSSASKGPAPLLSVAPLTSYPGTQRSPSLSPDGRRFAFAWTGQTGDNLDIYVRNVDGGAPVRLTSDPAADDYPAWSPDGGWIAFLRSGVVFIVPSGGGNEKKIADVAGSGVAWSPDGRLLAICAQDPQIGSAGIALLTLATGRSRWVTHSTPSAKDEFPEFSWDGKEVAFVRTDTTISDVYAVPAAGGTPPRRLTTLGEPIRGVAWTSDDRFVILDSAHGLFRVPAHGSGVRTPVRVATSDESARQPSISFRRSDGRSQLAFARAARDTDIVGMPIGGSGSAVPTPITRSTLADHGPSFSPDGTRLAFSSGRTGMEQIWVCEVSGLNPRQLTFFESGLGASSPVWSPDGKTIAFDATARGNRDVYTVPADGGKVIRMTDRPTSDAQPSWSHDGRWIYFMSDRSGARQIWKMRADGSEPRQVTKNGGYQAFESADGKRLFYAKERSQRGIWSVPPDGGDEIPVLESAWHNSWALSGNYIYYLDFDRATPSMIPANRFDIRTGAKLKFAQIPPPVARDLPAFAVNPSARFVVWVVPIDSESGLMLVRDFRW